jgi:hypothetical protein
MSESARQERHPTGGRLVIAFVVLAVLGTALFLVGSLTATSRQEELDRAWAETLGSWDDMLAEYPARAANRSALEVERLSAAAGIDIAPLMAQGRARPSAGSGPIFDGDTKAAVFEYLEAQLESAKLESDPPPEVVSDFLATVEPQIDDLARHLHGAATPHWELDVEQGFEMQIPNLLGHINLQRLLSADALARASRGDNDGALRNLEASWKLNETLRTDPALITQLVSMAIARIQVGTLRHLDPVPAVWSERVLSHDYKNSLVAALRFEGLVWTRLDEVYPYTQQRSAWQAVVTTASKPYVRWCATDIGESWRQRVVKLSELDWFCDRDFSAVGADLAIDVPWWNRVGHAVAIPNLAATPIRVGRYELDAEITAKLLELRRARRENGGRWPDSVPGIRTSRVCPEDAFVYGVADDGTLRFEFGRPIEWEGQQGARLPNAYVLPPEGE